MVSSAIASSSPVVTPGRTAARTAPIARATTSPAPRMSSISCGVLIWIMRPLHFATSGRRARIPADMRGAVPSAAVGPSGLPEGGHHASGDLLDGADRVDARQQPLALVEPRQRRGLFPVDLQAVPHGLGP